ncbi:MAG: 4Fe-4S binding protein [Candidatus Omnitrophota bacterium]
MKRKIIKIDEDNCSGCGECIPNCPEGAIQIIDGKARIISDLFCDGLGACIGHCPQQAISIEEREAKPYDEKKTMENIIKAGPNVISAHLEHLKNHNQADLYKQAIDFLKEKKIKIPAANFPHHHGDKGCPGMKVVDLRQKKDKNSGQMRLSLDSQLNNWPVQLKLLNPQAPYFKDADIVVAADCVPFAFANFHQKFLKGKTLVIFCPKLDSAHEEYVEKLTQIFKNNNIKSITAVHMEVPCCFGTSKIVEEAVKQSGKNIVIKDYTISLKGELV